jgi:hypothetical protein
MAREVTCNVTPNSPQASAAGPLPHRRIRLNRRATCPISRQNPSPGNAGFCTVAPSKRQTQRSPQQIPWNREKNRQRLAAAGRTCVQHVCMSHDKTKKKEREKKSSISKLLPDNKQANNPKPQLPSHLFPQSPIERMMNNIKAAMRSVETKATHTRIKPRGLRRTVMECLLC